MRIAAPIVMIVGLLAAVWGALDAALAVPLVTFPLTRATWVVGALVSVSGCVLFVVGAVALSRQAPRRWQDNEAPFK